MIQINQREADYIIKNVTGASLHKASIRKKHGGKTYYVLCDDYAALKALTLLRGYRTVKDLLYYENKL